MDFFDPHFHVWDVSEGTASGHDASILFAQGGNPVYGAAQYEASVATGLPQELRHVGGVFLEAVSVCHTSMKGTDPAFVEHCKAEAKWAHGQLSASEKSYSFVFTAPLESESFGAVLDEYAKLDGFRGIRQIVNKDPNWPRNGGPDLLAMAEWVKGLGVLASKGFSFDLQLNPRQFSRFAEIYATVPDMTVVINHLGCPTISDLTEKPEVYFDGLKALAKFPNCYIKLSMLCYTAGDWDTNEVVTSAVKRVIDIFGAGRCMFASNYPPDLKDAWPSERLFPAFLKLVDSHDAKTKALLFGGSARRAYRC